MCTWQVAILSQQGIKELDLRGRTELADTSFINVPSINENSRFQLGVFKEGVELVG